MPTQLGADYLKSLGDISTQQPDMGALARLLSGASMVIPRTAELEANSVSQIIYGHKLTEPTSAELLPPAKTFGQGAADFAGNTLPYLAAVATGSGAVSRAIPGLTGLASKVLTGAGGFGFAGASEGRDVGLEQAAEGAVLGPIEMLPRLQRAIPAAALALGSREFFNNKNPEPVIGDFAAGDIAGAANFILPMLPGARKATISEVHNAPAPAPHYPTAGMAESELRPGGLAAGPEHFPGAYDAGATFGPGMPGPAAESAAAMQQAQATRLQALQNSGLMPYQMQGVPATGIKAMQDLALGQTPSEDALMAHGYFLLNQPQEPIRLGYTPPNPASAVPESISPSAIVPYEGGASQPAVRVQSPLYHALGIASPEPVDHAVATHLEGGKPNQSLMFALLGHEVNDADIVRKTSFRNFTANLMDMPQNTIVLGSDPWSEMLAAGGAAHAPVLEKTISTLQRIGSVSRDAAATVAQELHHYSPEELTALQRYFGATDSDPETLAQIITRRKKLSETETTTPFTKSEPSVGGRGHPSTILTPFNPDESGQVHPDVLNALGMGAIRAGLGATAGGVFAANDNNPNTDPTTAMMLGAAAGAFGPMALRHGVDQLSRLTEVFRKASSESGAIGGRPAATPALKLPNGEIVTKPGARAHFDLYPDLPDHAFNGGEPEHGFVKNDGTWMNRAQANSYATEISPDYAAYAAQHGVSELHSQNVPHDLQPLQNLPEMKKGRTEAGQISDEMRSALGRASIGAVIGSAAGSTLDDPGSHDAMAAGLVVGAVGGMFGPSLLRALAKNRIEKPETPKVATSYSIENMIAKAKLSTFQQGHNAGLADKVVARFDNWFGLSKDSILLRMLGDARGAAAEHLSKIDESFQQIKTYDVDQTVRDSTNKFLNGDITANAYRAEIGADVNPKLESYANFAIVARQAVDGLIDVGSRGLGNTKRTAMMQDSMGKYLKQSYKLFLTKYSPSESAIQNLADKIVSEKLWKGADNVGHMMDQLRQYAQEIQETKGVYHPTEGKNIDQNLFRHRKILSIEMKDFLGEITDPIQRVNLTVLKLRPLAEASDFMAQVAKGTKTTDGLQHSFGSKAEIDGLKTQLLQSLQNAPEGEKSAIQKKLDELGQYYYVKDTNRYGALGGQFVHRTVFDVLNEWDEAAKTDSSFSRAMLGLNSMMKANVTYRNPLAIVRQIMTAPFFMQIGRADYSYVGEAWNALKDSSHPLHGELLRRGIVNVDAVSRDVYRELDTMSQGLMIPGSNDSHKAWMGRIDNTIATVANATKKADLKMADWFRTPDNIVRITTYMTAKERIAKALGLALEDPTVADKAVEFTNRYTMNYEHLPKAIKAGRGVPGVNLFLSYASEITRLMKNMGQDMIQGDIHGGDGARMNAVKSLAFITALPSVAQTISENNLSDKDRKDWDQVKKNLPGYARNRFFFVQNRDPKTKQFHYIDFTSLVPTDQFLQTARALGSGDVTSALSVNPLGGLDNSPVFNIAASLITQRNTHTQIQARGIGDNIANVSQEIMGPLTPGTGSISRYLTQALTPNAEGSLGVTDKNGRTLTPADLIPWAAGARSGTYSLEAQQAKAVAEYKQNVANEMYYLNQVLKSNTNNEAKQKATERTKNAIIALQRQIAERLGVTTASQAAVP